MREPERNLKRAKSREIENELKRNYKRFEGDREKARKQLQESREGNAREREQARERKRARREKEREREREERMPHNRFWCTILMINLLQ